MCAAAVRSWFRLLDGSLTRKQLRYRSTVLINKVLHYALHMHARSMLRDHMLGSYIATMQDLAVQEQH